MPTERNVEVRLQGWEEFNDKVDPHRVDRRLGAFQFERHPAFFETAYNALPDDGTMLLHNITGFDLRRGQKLGLHMTFEDARFAWFIMTEIFPGGRLPSVTDRGEEEKATEAGFNVTQLQEIGPHYASDPQDLGRRARGPQGRGHRDPGPLRSTTATTSTSTAALKYFASGHISVHQFALQK